MNYFVVYVNSDRINILDLVNMLPQNRVVSILDCWTEFFPERPVHFTILTDDNEVLICTRAQDNGKAIETTHNNSLLGKYFRRRLNVPLGALVTVEHLQTYGRTDIDFYKIDDETYRMDFSPRN